MKGKQTSRISYLVLCVVLLTGCSSAQVDSVRPEVNLFGGLEVDQEYLTPEFQAVIDDSMGITTGGPSTGGGISGSDDSGSSAGIGPETPETTEGTLSKGTLPEMCVAGSDYNKYLNTCVWEPLNEIIRTLDMDARQKLYVRVFNIGYNPIGPDSSLSVKRAESFDKSSVYDTYRYFSGKTIPHFAYEWLKRLHDNDSAIEQSEKIALSVLEKSGLSDTTKLLDARSNPSNAMEPYLSMWGSTTSDCATFKEYRDAVDQCTWDALPNLRLVLRFNTTTNRSITLNPVEPNGVSYTHRMVREDINMLFTTCSQYTDLSTSSTFRFYETDESSSCYACINGFCRTIVVISCAEGSNLVDVLGLENYKRVDSIFDSILSFTDCQAIAAIEGFAERHTIAKGARGVL